MRWVSPGASRAAVSGSRRASSARERRQPLGGQPLAQLARAPRGSPGGIGLIPSNSARR